MAGLALLVGLAFAGRLPFDGSEDDEPARVTDERAQDPTLAPESGLELAVHEALRRGLAWLAEGQDAKLDGSLPVGDVYDQHVPIAATALGALAMMAAGNGVERGPLGANVARAVDYLLAHANTDPRHPEHGFIGRESDPTAIRMHSFGFAALALAQAHGLSPHSQRGRQLGRALEAAVRLIERTQGTKGGWYYEPKVMALHEGSVTICLVQVLRAARNAGIRVDASVIARAEKYVHASQVEDGLFTYELGDPNSHTSIALTAAAVCTLYAVGDYASDSVERGIDAIWRELALRRAGEIEPPRFPYYERFYLAQAFWQNTDPEHFRRWSRDEFRVLIASQEPDGRWTDARHGDGYATAVNCLVLAMSDQLLPIFQR